MRCATSSLDVVREKYRRTLIEGDRPHCHELVGELRESGLAAGTILSDLVWPIMCLIREQFRDNIITNLQMNLATRLNRTVTDRLGGQLLTGDRNGRKAVIYCGNGEPEELGGQICADVFEAAGYHVLFLGGNVPDDEILQLVGRFRPDLMILFATLANQLPAARKLVGYLHEVNACPDLQVLCCGGIYERAEGLAEEIGADLYAPDAESALEVAAQGIGQRASLEQQTVGRTRRIKRAEQRRALAEARTALRNVRRQAA